MGRINVELQAPSHDEVQWLVTSVRYALDRAPSVRAQTWIVARERAAVLLGVAPEAVELVPAA